MRPATGCGGSSTPPEIERLLVLSVVVAAVPGALWSRRAWAPRAEERIWKGLYWTGIPLGAVLLTASPIRTAGAAAAGAAMAVAALLPLAWWYASRRFTDPRERATFVLSVFWGNLGWLGLPVVAAVLGTDALPAAVLFAAVVGPQHFLVGITIAAHAGGAHTRGGIRAWLVAAARNHYLVVTLAALAYAIAGLPVWHGLVDVANWLVIASAAPAFFAFGVVMARAPKRADRDLGAALCGRFVLGPALLAPVALVTHVPAAFWWQAAAASGMTPLALAAQHGLPRERLAATVLWSTCILGAAAAVAVALHLG